MCKHRCGGFYDRFNQEERPFECINKNIILDEEFTDCEGCELREDD